MISKWKPLSNNNKKDLKSYTKTIDINFNRIIQNLEKQYPNCKLLLELKNYINNDNLQLKIFEIKKEIFLFLFFIEEFGIISLLNYSITKTLIVKLNDNLIGFKELNIQKIQELKRIKVKIKYNKDNYLYIYFFNLITNEIIYIISSRKNLKPNIAILNNQYFYDLKTINFNTNKSINSKEFENEIWNNFQIML